MLLYTSIRGYQRQKVVFIFRFHALQHSQFVESRVYEEDIQADTCPKEEKVLQDVS